MPPVGVYRLCGSERSFGPSSHGEDAFLTRLESVAMHANTRCRLAALDAPRYFALVASIWTLSLAGCLDADAINESQTAESQAAKFAEIDLGEYLIALPHMPGKAEGGLVNFHAFGKVE